MAIEKAELSKILTKKQLQEVKILESHFDKELREEYTGDQGVIIQLNNSPNPKIQHELERRYRQAGWKIVFHSDQREGEWVELR